MNSFIRSWGVLILVLLSITIIIAHKVGMFAIELDVLGKQNHAAVYSESSKNIVHYLENDDGTPALTCKVQYLLESNYCAVTLQLSRGKLFDNISKGTDLSIYNTLDVDIRYSSPVGSPNIRVSFRNYNPNYAVDGDYTSLKYNTFVFEPHSNNFTSAITLESLHVEEWWVKKFDIKHPLNQI